MGKKTYFDMGKNLHTSRYDIPPFIFEPLPVEMEIAIDMARDAEDEMACVTGILGNPVNTGTGRVIDLKPEDYRVIEEQKQLQGASAENIQPNVDML